MLGAGRKEIVLSLPVSVGKLRDRSTHVRISCASAMLDFYLTRIDTLAARKVRSMEDNTSRWTGRFAAERSNSVAAALGRPLQ